MSNTILSKHRIIDPLLTNIARGYSNNEFIGDKLFPTVAVQKESGKIPTFGKEMFRVYDTFRALRADSNKIEGRDISLIDYNLEEHDLERPIDYREADEAMLDLRQYAALQTTEGLRLKREKTIADIAQNAANFSSNNKATLTTNQFNDSGIDPAEIIRDANSDLSKIIGKNANAIFMGGVVFDSLLTNPKLIELIKYSGVGVLTEALLKTILGIDNIYVGRSLYIDDAGAFQNIWNDNVLLAYIAPPQGIDRNVYEPCFGYTLQKKGYPYVDKYLEKGGKIEIVRSTDLYGVKLVGAESGYLLSDVLG